MDIIIISSLKNVLSNVDFWSSGFSNEHPSQVIFCLESYVLAKRRLYFENMTSPILKLTN